MAAHTAEDVAGSLTPLSLGMWQAAQGMMSPTMLPTPSLASEAVWCIVSPLEHLTGLLSPLAGMQRRQPHGLSTCQHGLQLTLLGTFSEASENNSNRERDCSYRDKGQVRRPVVSNRGPQGLITSERVPLKLLALSQKCHECHIYSHLSTVLAFSLESVPSGQTWVS